MILIINLCKEKLHYFEFVKPVEDILRWKGINFKTKHYNDIDSKMIEEADKIIICGTSLKDNDFTKNAGNFSWVKEAGRPVLGICAGMQLIGLTFGGMLKKKTEIGFYKEKFGKNFLGLKGEQEVYHLHNYYCSFGEDFEVFCAGNRISQAVKHKTKPIYGVLFHPEVRQKEMIVSFLMER